MKQLFVAAIVLLAAGIGAQAQVYFSADFSAAQGYTNGPLIGQPAGAAVQWTNPNPNVPTDDIVVENEQLIIRDVTTGGRWASIVIPTQKDVFTFEFDWQYVGPPTGTIDVGICLSDNRNFELVDGNPVPNYNEQGTMIRMYQAGAVDVRDGDWEGGGTYAAMAELKYQDGKRFHIRMEVDAKKWEYDVYFKFEGDTQETMIADNYGYRRLPTVETDGLNCLVIWDNVVAGTLGSSVILDNFIIYGPTSVSDWSIF